ncbi:hypothetical protein [Natrinema zhouii]
MAPHAVGLDGSDGLTDLRLNVVADDLFYVGTYFFTIAGSFS